MIVTTRVIPIGAEETFFLLPFESDTEIIAHRVDRCLQVLHMPFTGTVLCRFEQVETTHARMAVRGKVERNGVAYIREHFISGRIDLRPQVFHRAKVAADQSGTEDIFSPEASDGIRYIIQVFSIG